MSKFSIMQNLRECFSNMVGKNNNYVRESKSNEHFQRFALRKLSVGVVSVAVAAGFYLGSGTTAQAATAESDASAKTEQVVQRTPIQPPATQLQHLIAVQPCPQAVLRR